MEDYEKIKVTKLSKNKNSIYFFLKDLNFSENYIKNLRKNPKAIKLNGDFTNIKQVIKLGDEIEILKNPNSPSNIPACDGKIDILFEDDDYLIVFKPHNLACIPTRSHINNNLGGQIVNYMHSKDNNFVLRILNRLDKETAGIVVTAKNVLAYNNIKLNKEYHALCFGEFDKTSFTINFPILTITNNGINEIKRVISPLGKTATTHVEILKQFKNYSLIKLNLETGRTHQIRVHMASINHSLIGDSIYSTQDLKYTHTFLILKKVSFKHYKTGKNIELEVNYPEDWKSFIK